MVTANDCHKMITKPYRHKHKRQRIPGHHELNSLNFRAKKMTKRGIINIMRTCVPMLLDRTAWIYQRGNQKPQVEEVQNKTVVKRKQIYKNQTVIFFARKFRLFYKHWIWRPNCSSLHVPENGVPTQTDLR
jgi:hypothetical protein